jgi:hypothetical protein
MGTIDMGSRWHMSNFLSLSEATLVGLAPGVAGSNVCAERKSREGIPYLFYLFLSFLRKIQTQFSSSGWTVWLEQASITTSRHIHHKETQLLAMTWDVRLKPNPPVISATSLMCRAPFVWQR